MKKMMATLLVFSLAFHYPSLSAEELDSYVYDRHSSLPISEVSTFWFIANTFIITSRFLLKGVMYSWDSYVNKRKQTIIFFIFILCSKPFRCY